MRVVPVPGETIAFTLARLRADADVEYAEPDQRRYPHAPPNDPLYVNQWYEQNAQPAAIDATTAWDTTTGRSDIVIADLDTGKRAAAKFGARLADHTEQLVESDQHA